MQGAATQSVLFVLGLITSTVAFIGLIFGINKLLSPRAPNHGKGEPYECGIDQAGSPWVPVRLRFSTIALLFVLFDAEAVLLFAVAPALRGSVTGLIEVGIFATFLAFGLMYAWRKGALEWL